MSSRQQRSMDGCSLVSLLHRKVTGCIRSLYPIYRELWRCGIKIHEPVGSDVGFPPWARRSRWRGKRTWAWMTPTVARQARPAKDDNTGAWRQWVGGSCQWRHSSVCLVMTSQRSSSASQNSLHRWTHVCRRPSAVWTRIWIEYSANTTWLKWTGQLLTKHLY